MLSLDKLKQKLVGRLGYQRILVSLDLSRVDDKFLQRAAQLASMCNAELILLHVVAPSALSFWKKLINAHAEEQFEQRCIEQASLQLEYLRAHLECEVSHIEAVCAPLMEALEEKLDEYEPDLLILGHHHFHYLYQKLQTQMAEPLIQDAQCDLLVLEEEGLSWHDPVKMLLAVDLDATADPLLARASGLARRMKAELSLVHVIDLMQCAKIARDMKEDSFQRQLTLENQAVEEMQQLQAKFEYPVGQMHVASGNVSHEIMNCAKREHVDLLLVGCDETAPLASVGKYAEPLLHQGGGDILVMRLTKRGHD